MEQLNVDTISMKTIGVLHSWTLFSTTPTTARFVVVEFGLKGSWLASSDGGSIRVELKHGDTGISSTEGVYEYGSLKQWHKGSSQEIAFSPQRHILYKELIAKNSDNLWIKRFEQIDDDVDTGDYSGDGMTDVDGVDFCYSSSHGGYGYVYWPEFEYESWLCVDSNDVTDNDIGYWGDDVEYVELGSCYTLKEHSEWAYYGLHYNHLIIGYKGVTSEVEYDIYEDYFYYLLSGYSYYESYYLSYILFNLYDDDDPPNLQYPYVLIGDTYNHLYNEGLPGFGTVYFDESPEDNYYSIEEFEEE